MFEILRCLLRRFLWRIGCWLVLVAPSAIWSQQVATGIAYADPSPVIDGQGDDWPRSAVISYTVPNPEPGRSNSLAVELLWDEQYLYLYAEVLDEQLVSLTHDSLRRYMNDAVELYIDPLDDSGKRMDINGYQYIVDFEGRSAVLKGEKSAIQDSSKTAPKDYGIATVAFQVAAGKLTDEGGSVSGYSIEMAVPFAGMGAIPKAGSLLKIDFCVDDADSLVDLSTWPENTELPLFFCSNWEGYLDFSFPDHWHRFELTGGPSVISKIGRAMAPYWLYVLVAVLATAGLVIFWQARRIAELKDVLPKTTLDPSMMLGLLEKANLQNPTASAPVEPPGQMAEEATPSEASIPNTTEPRLGVKHPLVERCRQFVLTRLDQELMMEDLATECAVSLRQLQRIFKEEIDMSPGNFVVIIKMERAAELLRDGRHNVSEAAWELGFQDSSYFSRVFKKYHGMSPKQFLAS